MPALKNPRHEAFAQPFSAVSSVQKAVPPRKPKPIAALAIM
jgi:hypothetical protein